MNHDDKQGNNTISRLSFTMSVDPKQKETSGQTHIEYYSILSPCDSIKSYANALSEGNVSREEMFDRSMEQRDEQSESVPSTHPPTDVTVDERIDSTADCTIATQLPSKDATNITEQQDENKSECLHLDSVLSLKSKYSGDVTISRQDSQTLTDESTVVTEQRDEPEWRPLAILLERAKSSSVKSKQSSHQSLKSKSSSVKSKQSVKSIKSSNSASVKSKMSSELAYVKSKQSCDAINTKGDTKSSEKVEIIPDEIVEESVKQRVEEETCFHMEDTTQEKSISAQEDNTSADECSVLTEQPNSGEKIETQADKRPDVTEQISIDRKMELLEEKIMLLERKLMEADVKSETIDTKGDELESKSDISGKKKKFGFLSKSSLPVLPKLPATSLRLSKDESNNTKSMSAEERIVLGLVERGLTTEEILSTTRLTKPIDIEQHIVEVMQDTSSSIVAPLDSSAVQDETVVKDADVISSDEVEKSKLDEEVVSVEETTSTESNIKADLMDDNHQKVVDHDDKSFSPPRSELETEVCENVEQELVAANLSNNNAKSKITKRGLFSKPIFSIVPTEYEVARVRNFLSPTVKSPRRILSPFSKSSTKEGEKKKYSMNPSRLSNLAKQITIKPDTPTPRRLSTLPLFNQKTSESSEKKNERASSMTSPRRLSNISSISKRFNKAASLSTTTVQSGDDKEPNESAPAESDPLEIEPNESLEIVTNQSKTETVEETLADPVDTLTEIVKTLIDADPGDEAIVDSIADPVAEVAVAVENKDPTISEQPISAFQELYNKTEGCFNFDAFDSVCGSVPDADPESKADTDVVLVESAKEDVVMDESMMQITVIADAVPTANTDVIISDESVKKDVDMDESIMQSVVEAEVIVPEDTESKNNDLDLVMDDTQVQTTAKSDVSLFNELSNIITVVDEPLEQASASVDIAPADELSTKQSNLEWTTVPSTAEVQAVLTEEVDEPEIPSRKTRSPNSFFGSAFTFGRKPKNIGKADNAVANIQPPQSEQVEESKPPQSENGNIIEETDMTGNQSACNDSSLIMSPQQIEQPTFFEQLLGTLDSVCSAPPSCGAPKQLSRKTLEDEDIQYKYVEPEFVIDHSIVNTATSGESFMSESLKSMLTTVSAGVKTISGTVFSAQDETITSMESLNVVQLPNENEKRSENEQQQVSSLFLDVEKMEQERLEKAAEMAGRALDEGVATVEEKDKKYKNMLLSSSTKRVGRNVKSVASKYSFGRLVTRKRNVPLKKTASRGLDLVHSQSLNEKATDCSKDDALQALEEAIFTCEPTVVESGETRATIFSMIAEQPIDMERGGAISASKSESKHSC